MHDAKPALLAFARARLGRWPASRVDTALAAYLAKPDQRTYDLTDLALRYLQARAAGRTRRTTASSPSTASATRAPPRRT